jgi:hypothetical protein
MAYSSPSCTAERFPLQSRVEGRRVRRSSTALTVLLLFCVVAFVAGCGDSGENDEPATVQTETDGEGGENENEPGEIENGGGDNENEGGGENENEPGETENEGNETENESGG